MNINTTRTTLLIRRADIAIIAKLLVKLQSDIQSLLITSWRIYIYFGKMEIRKCLNHFSLDWIFELINDLKNIKGVQKVGWIQPPYTRL